MMYKASKLMSETSKLMFRARAKGEIKVNAARNRPICARGSSANHIEGAATLPATLRIAGFPSTKSINYNPSATPATLNPYSDVFLSRPPPLSSSLPDPLYSLLSTDYKRGLPRVATTINRCGTGLNPGKPIGLPRVAGHCQSTYKLTVRPRASTYRPPWGQVTA
jgi:hypothetical protein